MSGAALDPEEPVLSPACAPAVLHDPEVLSALGSVAHCSNCMVVGFPAVWVGCLLAAPGVVKDAVAVVK